MLSSAQYLMRSIDVLRECLRNLSRAANARGRASHSVIEAVWYCSLLRFPIHAEFLRMSVDFRA